LNKVESAKLSHACLAEVLKETARRCGGTALEQGGLLRVAGRHPCPIFVNSAMRTGPMAAQEALGRAAAFFGERGHGYEFWIRAGADDDLEKAAAESGMRFAVELTGMVLHETPLEPDPIRGAEVRRVASTAEFQDFREVVAEGFQDEAPGCADLLRSIFHDPETLLVPDTAAFVVYADGVPASASMTMLKNGIAWIGWIATRKEFRRRGFGRLATTAATRAGFVLGASVASLEATRMGAPVYGHIGFQEVIRYRNYSPRTV
jgi:hypothetical protein